MIFIMIEEQAYHHIFIILIIIHYIIEQHDEKRRFGLEQKENQKTRDPNIKRRPKPRRGSMLKKDEH